MPTPTISFLDKYHPDPRRRRVYDAADPNAYGPDGLLRDGVSIRVGLADSAPPRPSEPMIITTNLPKELALKRFFFPDGSPRPAREPREARARPVPQQKDAATIALDAAMADLGNPHKPGFRFADADRTTNDAAVEAYNLYCRELGDAWKTPERKAQDAKDAQRTDPPKPDDFVEQFPGEWQRKLATDELVAESNRPAPGTRWGDEGIEKEGSQAPKGIPPYGGFPLNIGMTEGDICSVDGGRGRLVRRGDYLFCELEATKAVTVPPTNRSSIDAMSVAEGQAIKDAAWREMVDQVSNAWIT
jgi:hypothetical protein